MMNKIGVLSKTRLLRAAAMFFICIRLLTSPCFAQSNINNLNSLDTFESFFYIEYCPIQQFSFCSDGYEQPYRLNPLIVYLNEDDFAKSYEKIIFQLDAEVEIDTMTLSKSYQLSNDFDIRNYLTEFSVHNGDTVSIYLGHRFKRKINRYYRRNGIKKHFNGRIYYAGLKMKFIAEKEENEKKYNTIPDNKSKKRNQSMVDIPVDEFYVIKKILSIG